LVLRVQHQLEARVLITFGQTECHGTMCMTRPDDSAEDISETVGVPIDDVEVKIADPESGDTVPLGTPGEILVRGPQVMAGYYNAPVETAAAITEDGWLRFGDLGTMDHRGYLRVIGRLKDMVIRGGENIYPREIEEILLAHPAVADAAVVGVPDETWGEEVAAVIRPAPGIDGVRQADQLYEHCRGRLAAYKCPRLWFFVGDLPLTPSGKVQKHRLVSMIAEGELRPAATFVRKIGRTR
jgi:fatty-acyl-CoA synthase